MIWPTLVAKALPDRTIYAQFRDTVTGDMFNDRKLDTLWTMLGEFHDEYSKAPTHSEMLMWLRRLPEAQKEHIDDYIRVIDNAYTNPPQVSDDVLAGEVTDSIKQHLTEKMILAGSAMLDSGRVDYDGLESQMRQILATSVDLDLGVDIGSDPKAAMAMVAAEERFQPIPTGITGMDKSLGGGWRRRQFCCGIGASGIGKSTFLVNHACAGVHAGFDTLLLTVELDVEAVVERTLRRITQRPVEQMLKEYDESVSWITKWFSQAQARLFVRQARMGRFSVNELEAYLDRMEVLENFIPELIVVDYLDELKPSNTQGRLEKRHQHRGIAQDLVGLAKTRDAAVVTMTQTNREALEAKNVTGKHIGEDYGKIQVSDLVYAICQQQEEYEKNIARIRWLKKRDRGGRGQEIPVWVDYEIMMVESLDQRIVVAA